jgi:hypothetical protein
MKYESSEIWHRLIFRFIRLFRGDELKKADMLVTSGVVFSGTTIQRRVQHVDRLIVS